MNADRNNYLTVLAAEISQAHREQLADAARIAARAADIGRMLLEAKESVPHGGWLPWLEEIGLGIRTAQNYMRLAKLPPEQFATFAHLGLRGALDALAETRPARDEEEAENEEWLEKQSADIKRTFVDMRVGIGRELVAVKERLGEPWHRAFLAGDVDLTLDEAESAILAYEDQKAGVVVTTPLVELAIDRAVFRWQGLDDLPGAEGTEGVQ